MNDILENTKGIRYLRIDKSQINLKPVDEIKEIFCYCYFSNNNLSYDKKILVLSC